METILKEIGVETYLYLSALLFSIGVFGILLRRNAIIMFMCVELMLNAANLTFVALATQLGDINVFASGNKDGFIDDVVVSFGAPRYLVREYYYDRRWAPGDIYYACALAHQLGRPCLEVANYYQSNRGQGWGVVAQRLGIKPGSSAFHALKGKVGKGHDRMNGRGGPKASGGPKANRDAGPPARGQGGGWRYAVVRLAVGVGAPHGAQAHAAGVGNGAAIAVNDPQPRRRGLRHGQSGGMGHAGVRAAALGGVSGKTPRRCP